MEIVEFLEARLDEDEAVARHAQRAYQHVFGIPHYFGANSDTSVAMNPRVALAEIEAKRQVIEYVAIYAPPKTYAERCEHTDMEDVRYVITSDLLLHLARAYSDHPDFDAAWK